MEIVLWKVNRYVRLDSDAIAVLNTIDSNAGLLDVVLLSILGSMSSIFPKFKGNYHNTEVGVNLYMIIIAPPASGKGNTIWSRKILAPIEEQLHAENLKAMQVYHQKLEAKRVNT